MSSHYVLNGNTLDASKNHSGLSINLDTQLVVSKGEIRINTNTTNPKVFPSVTGLSDGGFIVTWEVDGQDGSFHGIYGQRYNASGNAVGSEFRINPYTTDALRSSVTSLANGGFVVTWESYNQDGSFLGIYG